MHLGKGIYNQSTCVGAHSSMPGHEKYLTHITSQASANSLLLATNSIKCLYKSESLNLEAPIKGLWKAGMWRQQNTATISHPTAGLNLLQGQSQAQALLETAPVSLHAKHTIHCSLFSSSQFCTCRKISLSEPSKSWLHLAAWIIRNLLALQWFHRCFLCSSASQLPLSSSNILI